MNFIKYWISSIRVACIISILLLISVIAVSTISCSDKTGPGPGEINAGPGEINAGPGEIHPGPGETELKEINGSGNIETREFDLTNFNKVEVSGEGVLVITQGDEESLVVETDDNLLEYVKVSISENKLKIENIVDEGYDLVPTDSIYYYLKLKELEELKLPGVVTVECENLQVSSLNLDMSGIADVRLTGNVDVLNISVSGIGTLNGRDYLSKECNISGTGNAEILLSVSETLDIVFTGIGTVKYIGEPEIKKDIGILVKIEKID